MAGSDRPVVYLYVGAPQSGTEFLRRVLWENRDALRESGVLYPGDHPLRHTHAALDLEQPAGHPDPVIDGAWGRLVEEIRQWPGTAIVCQEIFAPAPAEAVGRAMETLAFAEVHVVYSARDLARQIPGAWQEDLKNRYDLSFERFLQELRAAAAEGPGRHPLARAFWRLQDAAEVLARWGAHLPSERVHLVTVPPDDAPGGALWSRFCEVTGLDPAWCDTSKAKLDHPLGVAEASLLRRLNLVLNERYGEKIDWPLYNDVVTGLIAIDTLAPRPGATPITLAGTEHDWVDERSQMIVKELQNQGYDIVGDLTELLAAPRAETAVAHPDGTPETAMLDAAVEVAAALVDRLQRRQHAREAADADRVALRKRTQAQHESLGRLQTEIGELQREVNELRGLLGRPAAQIARRLNEKYGRRKPAPPKPDPPR